MEIAPNSEYSIYLMPLTYTKKKYNNYSAYKKNHKIKLNK